MKHLKPGNFCTINNHTYRAKKKTAGCKGCYFEYSLFMCPGLQCHTRDAVHQKINCQLDNIILTKV